MSAYVIANVNVKDADAYENYRSRTREIVERHGGRFVVRGGPVEVLEGDPAIHRLIILEFADHAAARRFYDSDDYQAVIPFRTSSADSTLAIVDGAE